MINKVIHGPTLFTDQDIYLFKEGTHFKLYEKMGAHSFIFQDIAGTYFAVWAPNAKSVAVVGEFNHWNTTSHLLANRWDSSGIFEGFIPGLSEGSNYKYYIESPYGSQKLYKSDPYAFFCEQPPSGASIIWNLNYHWNDEEWMKKRSEKTLLTAPFSIYEVHLGSWKKERQKHYSYKKMAEELVTYIADLGFTFVELLPLIEHPFFGSWGYQPTGYFASTSRYGKPQDLMFLIDQFHQKGIGVILDWVPSHFPDDDHGLAQFDGTHLYEHADPRKGTHPDWNTLIFNYGRIEVQEFLINSALFWLDKYHVDGIRVDAVASMLYLDYSRKHGEWEPNQFGNNKNLEAIEFIRKLNTQIYQQFPNVQVFAEESTAWPSVTHPVHSGGLGFGLKWNMGWMHDVLYYFSKDPIHRKYHHHQIIFSLNYAFTENFILPLSHDEVVHGKGSLFSKMPGDEWQKYAQIRLLFGFLYTHPGKKLLFMGSEFAQISEWNHDTMLEWNSWNKYQKKIHQWIKDLNSIYKSEPALYEKDFIPMGFEWLDCQDHENSTLSFIRKGNDPHSMIAVFCNFTPVIRYNYRIGIPSGSWSKLLHSDDVDYEGSGCTDSSKIVTESIPCHGRPHSLCLNLAPLSIAIYKFNKENS
ncbi:MAG: 1,4-alpha-glucan branching protein GlgB [Parachlamydiales bacterium]|nr:1,4-alpha-glucan branching protein GlgB [Parachlamydiales bacterium]